MKTLTFEPITREQIKDYCQASGDWNKIHWDEAFALEAGLPSVIAHGMLSMGLAGRALRELGYPMDQLKGLDAKFKEKVLPGAQLTAEVSEGASGEVNIRMSTEAGVDVLTATARF